MTKSGYSLLAIGFVFGCGVSSLFHCKMDLTAIMVAAVTAAPLLLGQILTYNLSKSNRTLIWTMHEENTEKLNTIKDEVNNGH